MTTELYALTQQGAFGAANDFNVRLRASAIGSSGTHAGCVCDHNSNNQLNYLRSAFGVTIGGQQNSPCFLILTPLL